MKEDRNVPPAFSRKQTQFWLKRPRDFDSAQNSLPEDKERSEEVRREALAEGRHPGVAAPCVIAIPP
jgi:hypothetical protein